MVFICNRGLNLFFNFISLILFYTASVSIICLISCCPLYLYLDSKFGTFLALSIATLACSDARNYTCLASYSKSIRTPGLFFGLPYYFSLIAWCINMLKRYLYCIQGIGTFEIGSGGTPFLVIVYNSYECTFSEVSSFFSNIVGNLGLSILITLRLTLLSPYSRPSSSGSSSSGISSNISNSSVFLKSYSSGTCSS